MFRRGDLMVSKGASGLSSPGSSSWHRVVLIRSDSASLHSGIQMGKDQFKASLSRLRFVRLHASGGFILIPRRRRKIFPLRLHVRNIVSS